MTIPPPDRQRPQPVEKIVNDFLDGRREEEAAFARRLPKPGRTVIVVLLSVLAAVVWIAPSFAGSSALPTVQPQLASAAARTQIFLAAQRVREFRRLNGRLPTTLLEANVTDALGFIQVDSANFEISADADGTPLTFRSSMDDRVFLGDALRVLRGAR